MHKASYIKHVSILIFIFFTVLFPIKFVIAQEEATDSSETIRERVQEKLNAALNKPKAYIGSITDITDSTIQLNNIEGEIQQIIIDAEETTFYNVGESEDIEYEDVAIGDEIVAIGYIDENNTLNSLRVLVTSSEEDTDRVIYNAVVVSVEDKTILLNDFTKGEVQLTFPRAWKGPEIEEFLEGQEVAAVSVNDDGVLTIRTIEILSEVETTPEEN